MKIKLHGLGLLDKLEEENKYEKTSTGEPELEFNFGEEEHVKVMGGIIKSVREIREHIRENGKITLEDAEKIANKHNVPLHLPLAELSSKCVVDYKQGIILCQD